MTVQQTESQPVIVAMPSDLHVASTLGLFPSDFVIHRDAAGDTTYQLSSAQRWLLANWNDDWTVIENRRKLLGAKLVTVFAGDLVENVHHRTVQVVTAKTSDHVRAAVELLDVPVARSDEVAVIRGTPAHVGEGAGLEEGIVDLLRATYPNKTIAMNYIYEADHGGVSFRIKHEGANTGNRAWTRGNGLRNMLQSQIISEVMNGETPPRIWANGHGHRWFHETVRYKGKHGQEYVMDGILLPAYQLATEFVMRISREYFMSDIGILWVEVQDGKFEVHSERIRSVPFNMTFQP